MTWCECVYYIHALPTTAESAPTGNEMSTVAPTGGVDGLPPGDGSTTETASDAETTTGHTEPATETSSEVSHSCFVGKSNQTSASPD